MTHKKQCLLPSVTAAVIFIMLMLAPLRVSAEAHGNFYIPDGAVPAGGEFTVTAEFTASESIGTVSAAVTYNESYMEFVSSDNASGGGGIVNINGFPDSESDSMTVTLTFRALQEGSAQINMVNGSVMTPDGISLSNAITAYATITIGPPSPSDSSDNSDSYENPDYSVPDNSAVSNGGDLVAVLKSLTTDVGELKPAFSPGIYDYTVTVPHDVDVLELDGVTANETDTIWYEGAKYLADGKNQQTVTVTSADGLVSNVYTVTIYREAADDEDDYEDETDSEDTEPEITSKATATVSASSAPAVSEDEKTGMDELRDKLMPALYIAMAVIVLAVIILIVWIRTKTKNRLK